VISPQNPSWTRAYHGDILIAVGSLELSVGRVFQEPLKRKQSARTPSGNSADFLRSIAAAFSSGLSIPQCASLSTEKTGKERGYLCDGWHWRLFSR